MLSHARHPLQTESETLDEAVYKVLQTRIRSGRYPMGGRLPGEHELAAEFGVSRPIVRTALTRLRDAGLIVSRRGSGSYVTDGGEEAGGFTAIGSIDDIAAFYQFRRFIEGEVSALAARNVTPDALEDLRASIQRMERNLDTGVSLADVDFGFHQRLAEIAGNRFLAETLQLLHPHLRVIARFVRTLSETGYRTGKLAVIAEHKAIVAALEAGDPERARAAAIAHIDGSQRRVFKGPSEDH